MTNHNEQRKMKQAARREARAIMSKMRELMADKICFERLETKFMKVKPRFLPLFVWRWYASGILDFKSIDKKKKEIGESIIR